MRRALVASAIVHAVCLALLLLLAGRNREPAATLHPAQSQSMSAMVWLNQPGPGGGGGGGGNRMQEPPRRAELPGRDRMTVPAAPRSFPTARAFDNERQLLQQLDIPARALAASLDSLPGAVEAAAIVSPLSMGPGTGRGAGTGVGPGDGSGTGPGLGPGFDGGAGEKVYAPGAGIVSPIPLSRGIPHYTVDAVRARRQGVIRVECIVQVSGQCTGGRVVKGLDPSFGLNEEAINAAHRWRFRPGSRLGEPVPVIVTIEITFTIR